MLSGTNSAIIASAVIASVMMLSGCGGGRGITVDGYGPELLNGKRVVMILPQPSDIRLTDPVAFANARGVAPVSAVDMLENEIRTNLNPFVDQALDSNEVSLYVEIPAGQMVPLSATADMSGSTPRSWEQFARGARQGGIDYMIVITAMTIDSKPNDLRGEEGATVSYSLLDPIRSRVMAQGTFTVDRAPMTAPPESYRRIADALVDRLPFHIRGSNH